MASSRPGPPGLRPAREQGGREGPCRTPIPCLTGPDPPGAWLNSHEPLQLALPLGRTLSRQQPDSEPRSGFSVRVTPGRPAGSLDRCPQLILDHEQQVPCGAAQRSRFRPQRRQWPGWPLCGHTPALRCPSLLHPRTQSTRRAPGRAPGQHQAQGCSHDWGTRLCPLPTPPHMGPPPPPQPGRGSLHPPLSSTPGSPQPRVFPQAGPAPGSPRQRPRSSPWCQRPAAFLRTFS